MNAITLVLDKCIQKLTIQVCPIQFLNVFSIVFVKNCEEKLFEDVFLELAEMKN